VVGINYYKDKAINPLLGCVNDAKGVKSVLDRHGDGSKNFEVKLKVASNKNNTIKRKTLKNEVKILFKDDNEIALFYFSGHGHIDSMGSYLMTSDCKDGDDGLSMSELLTIVNGSNAKNKIIVLDCCYSGEFGNVSRTAYNNALTIVSNSLLSEGTTILTASGKDECAVENNGAGLFTTLFIDAMNGSASDLMGNITPGSIYAHIDQFFGLWKQRPIFKANVKKFATLRKMQPQIPIDDLKKLVKLFHSKSESFKLDPTYEPKSECPNKNNVKKFELLKKYNKKNLVVPVDAEDMYSAAIKSKSCKLTIYGQDYWSLIKEERI
jgi:hypothetical protein